MNKLFNSLKLVGLVLIICLSLAGEVKAVNKDFLFELYGNALKVEKTYGIPALFNVAQAVLESGWELKPIKDCNTGKNSYNIFGIKHHGGDFVEAYTNEYSNGKWITIKARFQSYESFEKCFEDHSQLLLKPLYKPCLDEHKKTGNIVNYVKCVAKNYATDVLYADKILNIIETLKKYLGVEYKYEKEEAKKFVVAKGLFKPDGTEDYWTRNINREELAVILKRLGGA